MIGPIYFIRSSSEERAAVMESKYLKQCFTSFTYHTSQGCKVSVDAVQEMRIMAQAAKERVNRHE